MYISVGEYYYDHHSGAAGASLIMVMMISGSRIPVPALEAVNTASVSCKRDAMPCEDFQVAVAGSLLSYLRLQREIEKKFDVLN